MEQGKMKPGALQGERRMPAKSALRSGWKHRLKAKRCPKCFHTARTLTLTFPSLFPVSPMVYIAARVNLIMGDKRSTQCEAGEWVCPGYFLLGRIHISILCSYFYDVRTVVVYQGHVKRNTLILYLVCFWEPQ